MIDTNVLIEIFTTYDIEKDACKYFPSPTWDDLADPRLEKRRRNLVGSFALIHHIATNNLRLVMAHTEFKSKLMEYAAPNSDAGVWTEILLINIIGPVLGSVDNESETEHLKKTTENDEFDQYTRSKASQLRIPLITRDKESTKIAIKNDVTVHTPEEYLAVCGVSDIAQAIPRAVAWYRDRVESYLESHPESNVGHTRDRLMDPADLCSHISPYK